MERFLPDYRSCDVVIGYRADDSYFSFAKAFLNNTISLRLIRAYEQGTIDTDCAEYATIFKLKRCLGVR